MSPWLENNWLTHTQILLDSYHALLGEQLIERSGNLEEDAKRLFDAPFVVVSHGTESDPILNYGNQTALALWEMTIEQFVQTPSRMTAEPVHRDERARLLERTSKQGFVDDYRGIRVTSTGQRFLIERATVWNLSDASGTRVGQAATFSEWVPLTKG
ncbi:MAG: MEKHLA domain-containing protein [Planctomycetaceae bacterium]|nr:MEKHLA domain-containing protein [Planctomycetaceae bacterium]MCA9041304.1 MEKHLA domain-containing protein [Planctomycetaceae bacterium]